MPVMTGITVQNVAIAAEDLNGDYFEVVNGQVKLKPENENIVQTSAAAYTVTSTDHTIYLLGTGQAIALPAATTTTGRIIVISNPSGTPASTNIAYSDIATGLATNAIPPFSSVMLQSTGTVWRQINNAPGIKTTVITTDSISYPVAASDRYVIVNPGTTTTKDVVFPAAAAFPNRVITVRGPITLTGRIVTVKTAAGTEMTSSGGQLNTNRVAWDSIVMDDRAVSEATWISKDGLWKLINWTERKFYATENYSAPANASTFLSTGGVAPAAGQPYQIPAGVTNWVAADGNYTATIKLPTTNNATGRFSVYASNAASFDTIIEKAGTDLPFTAWIQSPLQSMHFEWANGLWRWVPAPEAPQGVSNQVAVQIGNPNITAPASIPTPVKGDIVVQTSDGTATGALQASYVWSGTAWVMQASNANATALASPSVRTYFTATTAFVDKFAAAETAASITSRGFTPVGAGAAAIPSTLGNYVNSFMITLQAPVAAQNAANIAAIFTPPTAYVRHEIAITAGVANSYALKMRSSGVDTVADVWVCDPVTGAPVERLHGTGTTRITASDQGTAFGLGPDESNAAWNREYEWVNWLIPAAVVAARKTGTNTIKLAIKPAIGNGNGINIDISGYAMAAVGNSQFASTPVFALDNQINGGIQAPYGGVTTGNPYGILNAIAKIPAVPGGGLRIAIPDITKDTWVSLISHGNGYGSWARNVELTLVSTATGNTTIGRPRPHQVGPLLAAICAQSGLGTMNANGWLIPANVLAAKAVKPVGSAVWYLEVAIANVSDLAAYMAGWFAETVN